MDVVFLLQHERPDTGDVKIIGVYRSAASAQAAQHRAVRQPGFCEYPEGFTISRYPLDKDHWLEGFLDL